MSLFDDRSDQEMRATFARLRSFLAEGTDPEEIAEKLGLLWEEYEELVDRFYKLEGDELNDRTREKVYIDYCIEQRKNIKDLDRIIAQFAESKQGSAMVGAVRAKSDILDRIIAKGQEFGFIEKQPETKIVAGVMVTQLTDKDLRGLVTSELAQLDRLLDKFGERPEAAGTILDVEPGPTHLPTPKVKAKALGPGQKAGTKRAKNKVHGGRRVVKKKAKAGT